jgi:hypothetical protein
MIVLVMLSRYEPFVSCGRSNWSPVLQVSTNIMNNDLAKQLSCRIQEHVVRLVVPPVSQRAHGADYAPKHYSDQAHIQEHVLPLHDLTMLNSAVSSVTSDHFKVAHIQEHVLPLHGLTMRA